MYKKSHQLVLHFYLIAHALHNYHIGLHDIDFSFDVTFNLIILGPNFDVNLRHLVAKQNTAGSNEKSFPSKQLKNISIKI